MNGDAKPLFDALLVNGHLRGRSTAFIHDSRSREKARIAVEGASREGTEEAS